MSEKFKKLIKNTSILVTTVMIGFASTQALANDSVTDNVKDIIQNSQAADQNLEDLFDSDDKVEMVYDHRNYMKLIQDKIFNSSLNDMPEINNNIKNKNLSITFTENDTKPTQAQLNNIISNNIHKQTTQYFENKDDININCNVNVNDLELQRFTEKNKQFFEFTLRHEIQHCINENNKVYNLPFENKEDNNKFANTFLNAEASPVYTIQHENKADTAALLFMMKDKNIDDAKNMVNFVKSMRAVTGMTKFSYKKLEQDVKDNNQYMMLLKLDHDTNESVKIISNNFDTLFNKVKTMNAEEINTLAEDISSIGTNNLLASLNLNKKLLAENNKKYYENSVIAFINGKEFSPGSDFNKDFSKTLVDFVQSKNLTLEDVLIKKPKSMLGAFELEKGKYYNEFTEEFFNKNKEYNVYLKKENNISNTYESKDTFKYYEVKIDENLNFKNLNDVKLNTTNLQKLNKNNNINYSTKITL